VALPWNQTIEVFPDGLGRNVIATGVFDPIVTETIYRLLDRGGVAIDVGANVGYFTNLMAARLGPAGSVLAFEPQPEVFRLLQRNVAQWDADAALAAIAAHPVAISDEPGTGRLAANTTPRHMGLAGLRDPAEAGTPEDLPVDRAPLDALLQGAQVQLIKIDVEGHEHAVLEGAEGLLNERRIRDIVFEDHEAYPTPAMCLLEHQGMTVFTLDRSIAGLRIHPVQQGPAPSVWPGRNYLATLAAERALERLAPKGWNSFT
jgi:FkbM family methyltransferase